MKRFLFCFGRKRDHPPARRAEPDTGKISREIAGSGIFSYLSGKIRVHEFIEKIVVSAPEYKDGKRYQEVAIYYNGVGIVREPVSYTHLVFSRNSIEFQRVFW